MARQEGLLRRGHAHRVGDLADCAAHAHRDDADRPVRATLGQFRALSVFLCKSGFYGAFLWARMALNRQKGRFPARAVAS
jgi:hypothetical protein